MTTCQRCGGALIDPEEYDLDRRLKPCPCDGQAGRFGEYPCSACGGSAVVEDVVLVPVPCTACHGQEPTS